jgi:hypothetical protein
MAMVADPEARRRDHPGGRGEFMDEVPGQEERGRDSLAASQPVIADVPGGAGVVPEGRGARVVAGQVPGVPVPCRGELECVSVPGGARRSAPCVFDDFWANRAGHHSVLAPHR